MNCRLLFHMTRLLMLFPLISMQNKYQRTGCPEKSDKTDLSSIAEVS